MSFQRSGDNSYSQVAGRKCEACIPGPIGGFGRTTCFMRFQVGAQNLYQY